MSSPKKIAARPRGQATAKKATTKRGAPQRSAPSSKPAIQIRMYNVGFGDCFLIRLPTEEGEKRVLVDCGFHTQGKGKFTDRELVTQIKDDLDGEPLDVVVATHRHQDHISGFGEVDLWRDIGVLEVWLPFTARAPARGDEPSLAAWNRLMGTAASLVNDDGELTLTAQKALGARSPDDLEAVAWMLWNARENAPGIENLRRGMKRPDKRPAKRRYLPEGDALPGRFETPVLPGVTVHVLGPPQDVKYRGKRKAPAGWGIVGEADAGVATSLRDAPPFGPEWRIPSMSSPTRPFQPKSLEQIAMFNDDLAAVAAAVDGFLNGESLVLVIELGEARLLLPGDAEVGTWMKILETPEAKALAADATFLKFGHHGSHNATPLAFLRDELSASALAMMSTQEGPGRYRNGIPRPELIDTLGERHISCARSDLGMVGAANRRFKRDPEERWIDCSVPC